MTCLHDKGRISKKLSQRRSNKYSKITRIQSAYLGNRRNNVGVEEQDPRHAVMNALAFIELMAQMGASPSNRGYHEARCSSILASHIAEAGSSGCSWCKHSVDL